MSVSNRLHHHTAHMVSIETRLSNAMKRLSEQVDNHPGVSDLFQHLCTTSESHLRILHGRLKAIGAETEVTDTKLPEIDPDSENFPVSSALQHASALLNYAIVGYAMLRSIALRYRDSSLIGEDNTGDIAERHTGEYVNFVHKINQSLHNVVLWELDENGESCQCTCPGCGLGICMCAQGPRRTLSDIWMEPGPISIESEVFLHPPRPGSVADSAGLHHGDSIVAADGQKLESHFTLQGVIGAHESGEQIVLQVRRCSGELEHITVTRP